MTERTSEERKIALAIALGGELDAHPTYEALEAVVDGTADDVSREIVESHAQACEQCAAELRDLRELAGPTPDALRQFIPRAAWTATAAAAATIVAFLALRRNEPQPAIVPHPRTAPVVSIVDEGGVVTIDAAGNVRGAPKGFAPLIHEVLRSGTLPDPVLAASLRREADRMRGHADADGLTVIGPVGEVVLDAQPLFRWRAPRSAHRFEVNVFDELKEVAASGVLVEPSWRPPRPLPRGTVLQWQVAMRHGDGETIAPQPPLPPAKFLIVDAAAAAEIAAARRSGSHLLAAILAARAGARSVAQLELDALAALNPGSPTVERLRATYPITPPPPRRS